MNMEFMLQHRLTRLVQPTFTIPAHSHITRAMPGVHPEDWLQCDRLLVQQKIKGFSDQPFLLEKAQHFFVKKNGKVVAVMSVLSSMVNNCPWIVRSPP
jgi:hypothetical protein